VLDFFKKEGKRGIFVQWGEAEEQDARRWSRTAEPRARDEVGVDRCWPGRAPRGALSSLPAKRANHFWPWIHESEKWCAVYFAKMRQGLSLKRRTRVSRRTAPANLGTRAYKGCNNDLAFIGFERVSASRERPKNFREGRNKVLPR